MAVQYEITLVCKECNSTQEYTYLTESVLKVGDKRQITCKNNRCKAQYTVIDKLITK